MRLFSIFSLLVIFALQPVQAVEKTAADFLPPTIVVYAELPQPKLILRGVLNHPLRKKIEALDQYKSLLALPNYRQFTTVTKFVEAQLGMKWQAAVEKLAGGGIYAGLDATTNGFVVLMKASDKESLTKIKDTLLRLARSQNPKAIPQKKYRGITAYGLDKTILATVDQWAILVTKNKLATKILDL